LLPDDTIILSSHPIPGNEEIISKAINRLLRRGVNVIYDSMAQVHVSGHASQEEQKLMLNLVRPKHFVPMHGELRMLKRHSWLAEQVGIAKENIFAVENGNVIELQDGKVRVAERIPGKYVLIKSKSAAESVPATTQPRKMPAQPGTPRSRNVPVHPGTFVVNLSLDTRTNRLLENAEITTQNFVSAGDDATIIVGAVQKRVVEVIHSGVRVERDISGVVRSFVFKQTKRRPTVSVNITKV
jgi:ribonuclease J